MNGQEETVDYTGIVAKVKGVSGKMQIAKFCFHHISAPEQLIFKILGPTPYNYLNHGGHGQEILRIRLSEAEILQK